MNSIFQRSISNTEAANELFFHTHGDIISFSVLSQCTNDLQSSSVTPNGFLWWQKLAQSPLSISQSDLNELRQRAVQAQKNQALIQLLRSWREGDEQEQKDTWEYLKQALDEDRLSERKLFP